MMIYGYTKVLLMMNWLMIYETETEDRATSTGARENKDIRHRKGSCPGEKRRENIGKSKHDPETTQD
jgi:hypothetical protein